jgi:hypothetical protein
MTQPSPSPRTRLTVESLEDRTVPAGAGWRIETFDLLGPGALPAGWTQWASSTGAAFSTSIAQSFSGDYSLGAAGQSNQTARAWQVTPVPADTGVAATAFLAGAEPVQLLARGQNLGGTTPSYVAVSATSGLTIDLVRVVNGVGTTLATLRSADPLTGPWVRLTLQPAGSTWNVQVQRTDTGQYLTPAGTWQQAPANAISVTDSAVTADGLVGLNRPPVSADPSYVDDFTVLGNAPNPGPAAGGSENFDTTPPAGLPAGWSQWSNNGQPAFATSGQSLSAPQGLTSGNPWSAFTGRAWLNSPQPADVQASAALFLDQLIPGEVLVRGSNLNSAQPTFYAALATRTPVLQLVRVVNGVTTVLGSVTGVNYLTQKWVRVSVRASGDQISASLFRTDTGQYLTSAGQWQAAPTWALTVTDSAITAGGQVGLARQARYAGVITFDDFQFAATDTQPPAVAISAPAANATLGGMVTVQATATDNLGVTRVEFYVDGVLRAADTAAPYNWPLDTTRLADGAHTLTVRAVDAAGNLAQASQAFTVSNPTALPPIPAVPQHNPSVRVAAFAFSGTPIDAVAQQLLQNNVDLVVSAPAYLAQIHQLAPNTPQLIYTNVSNLYFSLLTDWLAFADNLGVSREAAFYHVTQPTPFAGSSPSSQPVTWFWDVERGAGTLTQVTAQAHTSAGIAFGAAGESVYLGFTDPYREINLTVSRPASGGWSGAWEYATRDSAGNLTWKPLTLIADGSAGMTQSGRITFDPPADWAAGALKSGASRLFYVRLRTASGGTAPVATVLGRDFVNANGGSTGTIPVFDSAADANHDGYLNDAEYANRRPGMDARFLSESRLFYPFYGQMRYLSNPASPSYQAWAVDYQRRLLANNPLAAGLFVDNAASISPLRGLSVLEPTARYLTESGALLAEVRRAVAPKWLLPNIGPWAPADNVIPNAGSWFAESELRPMTLTWALFGALSDVYTHQQAETNPPPLGVLDTLTPTAQVTDPRVQITSLAAFYTIADPTTTFFQYNGGAEPASSWTRHWVPAAAFDIGKPTAPWSVWATGADPTDPRLTYKVLARTYQNALVLYKPLSYTLGVGTGTAADATATWHDLGGTYRPLNADGTLGAPVTRISLRNAEGAILIKVTS